MASNPLRELNAQGQSVWLDYIRRWEIVSGHLKQLIDDDGLSGVTSNPSIFEKAIAGSKDYDDTIRELTEGGKEAPEIFERIAVQDIQMTADLLLPTYNATDGRDGFVSIEVSPILAHDTAATIEEARRLWREVNRPNLMVKVPATPEGLPAIEQLLGEGLNINITLLFAIERYEEVANAYLNALEKLARDGKPLDRAASVASFFVSRIDTLADQELEAKFQGAKTDEDKTKISGLFGKVAIANAKLAYEKFKEIFSTSRFRELAQKGARVQRMLWASTSTKDPKYSDVLYVENLIGPHTVNTMPSSTMAAFREHGRVRATVEEELDDSRRVFTELEEVGIDIRSITQKLEDDGVERFAKDFNKLLKCVTDKRQNLLTEVGSRDLAISGAGLPQAVDAVLEKLGQQGIGRRLWDRDPAIWKNDPANQKLIRNALGWLTVCQSMQEHLGVITNFVQEVRRAGFTHAVLLGMGGSSLCPDVYRATYPVAPGFLELHVLDSTVPASIAHVEESIDLVHALLIVSSKSGGTAETLSFFKYFYERLRLQKGASAGENFVAITDPGTSLEKLAVERNFRHVFHGNSDIGGRYSALSNFGMVPAALMGVDTHALLDRAEDMVQACGSCVPVHENPGLTLGAALGEAARMGRDKITFVTSPDIATFADWVEQLIAESTGKEGKGILPIAGEKLGEPSVYGKDRLFVHIKLAAESDESTERALKALEAAGHPIIRLPLRDSLELGREFFRWEVATAVAGYSLGINPFDQPNVQESKDNTNRLLEQFRSQGKFSEDPPTLESDGLKFFCDAEKAAQLEKVETGLHGSGKSLERYLTAFLRQAQPGDYLALMAYLQPTNKHTEILQSIRTRLRNATGLATTLGYGPRFLHSTGQLHKGGPNNGLFIQVTADDERDLPVPGEPYSFSVLKQAQALGDLRSLVSKQRRVIRLHLSKDVDVQLPHLEKLLEKVLKPWARAKAKAS